MKENRGKIRETDTERKKRYELIMTGMDKEKIDSFEIEIVKLLHLSFFSFFLSFFALQTFSKNNKKLFYDDTFTMRTNFFLFLSVFRIFRDLQ